MATLTVTEVGAESKNHAIKVNGNSNRSIEAELTYIVLDPKHEQEKPYRLNYNASYLDIPRSNVENENKTVIINNFRPLDNAKSYFDYGFTAKKWPTQLKPAEFNDELKVEKVFYPEVINLVMSLYPDAAGVEILGHQLRKRHPTFPVATGEVYEDLLPTTLTHIDFTSASAIRTSRAAFHESTEKCSRLITLNIWKSLQGPGNDWPIALCDQRTVDHSADLIGQDVVFHDRFTENSRLYYRPQHKWYWVEDLQLDEALVFVQTDTASDNVGVPHSGFYNPHVSADAALRVSVELRAFVYFQ